MSDLSRRDALLSGLYALPIAGLGAAVMAQDPTTRQRTQDPAARTNPAAAANPNFQAGTALDPVMAGCILIMGKTQTEMCKFALDRVRDNDLKEFIKAEIEEQEDLRKKLEDLGYQYPTTAISRADVTNNARAGRQITVGRTMLPAGQGEIVWLGTEIGDQCIATGKSELGKFNDKEFDKRFAGCQLGAHYGLFDHTVVYRKHATRDLASLLDSSRPNIERDIAKCKKMLEQLG